VTVKELVDSQMKDAMRAKDKIRVDTLRSILSQLSYRRIESGADLNADEQIEVVRKLIKQRNDSIEEYQKANREDLVERESTERAILKEFVPADMDTEEVRAIVREVLAGLDSASRTEGGAMKVLIPRLKGKVDGKVVRTLVAEELQSA
jgi:uncharacterized protein YqeY